MLRFLFLLLLNLLLTDAAGDTPSAMVDAVAAWGAEAAVDCCPPSGASRDSGDSAEEDDCCDEDYGMCCILIAAALPAAPLGGVEVPLAVDCAQQPLAAAGLLPRANSPPPNRPPIA